MNVASKVEKLIFGFNQNCLELTIEEGSRSFVFGIEVFGIAILKIGKVLRYPRFLFLSK